MGRGVLRAWKHSCRQCGGSQQAEGMQRLALLLLVLAWGGCEPLLHGRSDGTGLAVLLLLLLLAASLCVPCPAQPQLLCPNPRSNQGLKAWRDCYHPVLLRAFPTVSPSSSLPTPEPTRAWLFSSVRDHPKCVLPKPTPFCLLTPCFRSSLHLAPASFSWDASSRGLFSSKLHSSRKKCQSKSQKTAARRVNRRTITSRSSASTGNC